MATNEPTLFSRVARCPATREVVAAYGYCPLCELGLAEHEPEAADVVRLVDADDFAAWLCSLPRTP